MEQPILSPTLGNKIYNLRSITIAILLGGPLVVGYLMAANFKQLGEGRKGGRAWLFSILGFIALMVLYSFMPDSIPNVVYMVINYSISAYFIQRYQGAQIAAHIAAGGLTYKTYRAVIVGLISLAIVVAFILGCFAMSDMMTVVE